MLQYVLIRRTVRRRCNGDDMADLDDVQFDYAGAAELAAALRSTARVVDHQAGERERIGAQAQQEWRGAYRERFDKWLVARVRDGRSIADALRRLANQLDQAAADARAEQKRRERAREDRPWYEKLVTLLSENRRPGDGWS